MRKKESKPTVKIITDQDLCIGCGLCQISCRDEAIEIKFDKNKEYKPAINFDKCTYCTLCYANCPMASQNLNQRITESSIQKSAYGLEQADFFLKGYETNYDQYIKSSSGGILSALLKYLLEKGLIDAVVHAEQSYAKPGETYFKASLSTTSQEIDSKRSSFYYPIEFSGVCESIIADERIKQIAFLGTPCVISGLNYLLRTRKDLREKVRYKFALMCSHNTGAFFTDMLVKSISKDSEEKQFKLRDKENISTDDNFNNSVTYRDGKKKSISRYKTPFTKEWRGYSFAMNGCNYCPDFFGVDADAGFKDAWGFSVDQKEGETVLFSRNKEVSDLLFEMQDKGVVNLTEISKNELIKSQKMTVADKSIYVAYRQRKKRYLRKDKIKKLRFSFPEKLFLFINFRQRIFNQRFSKFLYRNLKKRMLDIFTKFSSFIVKKSSIYLSLLANIQEKDGNYKVLYTAGYGYENIGDEAQLSANLQIWDQITNKVSVTLLSPSPDYTRRVHGNYDVLYASRNVLWGYKHMEYSGLGEHRLFQPYFRFRLFGNLVSAFFIRHFNFGLFASPEKSYFLKRLKQADVLHIGGGGYLTGKTPSRLLDYMGLIKIAHRLGTDVILSGHNIGIWQNRYHKRIAKQLKKAKFIGLRDNDQSIESLKAIKVYNEEKVLSLFDDALFCEGASKEELNKYMIINGVDAGKKYILINSYYFKKTERTVKETLLKIAEIIDRNFGDDSIQILLLSMHASDILALKYIQSHLKTASIIFKHDDDFKVVIALIKQAYAVISMRHHPIIFAMSGSVPTVSVVFDDYFKHKNIGAMKLFGQERFVLREQEVESGRFEDALKQIISERDSISDVISVHTKEFEKSKGLVIKKYLQKYTRLKLNKL